MMVVTNLARQQHSRSNRRADWLPWQRKPSLGEVLATGTSSEPRSLPAQRTVSHSLQNIRRLFFPPHGLAEARTAPDQHTLRQEEQTTRARFLLALASTGVSAIGVLVSPLLTMLTLPVQVYFVGLFVYDGTRQLLHEHRPGMAVIDAIVTGWLLALGSSYFFAISLYAATFHLSRVLVQQNRRQYSDNLVSMLDQTPRTVRVARSGQETVISLADLDSSDVVIVHAGEMVPVDGRVRDGLATIDQQLLTGEALPVDKTAGDEVFASTLVLTGKLRLQVEQAGAQTVAAGIHSLLNQTSSHTESLTLQAEQVANRFALPMLALGAITLPVLGPMSTLTVLCAYVGYTLRIVGPLSVLSHLQAAMRHQLLIKDGRALEVLQDVDTVVFDKTGTLTQERPAASRVYAYADATEAQLLELAASAEYYQTHPIAEAIRQAATESGLPLAPPDDVQYEPGFGLRVMLDGRTVRVGSARFLEHAGIPIPAHAHTTQSYAHQRGHSLVYVALGNSLLGAIELAPTLRPAARQVVAALQQQHKTVWLLSGDHEQPTQRLAHALGIDQYQAEVLPADKATLVAELQQAGRTVCFVGDGVNDAVALKQANVALSLQGASSLAVDTAQIILLEPDLHGVLEVFRLAEQLKRTMQINLVLSTTPGFITIGGVYLLNFGLVWAYGLFYTGLFMGLVNASRPVLPLLADQTD